MNLNDIEKIKIESMPKVELHVHLEGAVGSATYFKLADKNNVKLPLESLSDWENYFKFKNFSHFIDVYGVAVSTIKKAEDLALIVEDFYKHQAKDNIIYSEGYLSASFLIENFQADEILDAIAHGMKTGEQKYDVMVNIIPDISRHLASTQHDVLNFVKAGHDRGLFIGLGLGGLETGYPPRLFTQTFKEAKKAGLKCVAHAGEAVGAESIWEAIKELKIERIGHGIRCIEDQNLIEYLKTNQIPLEVSPTSNYHLGVVKPDEHHPIRKMIDQGLLCTINTDDPVMFSTTLNNEYRLLMKQGFRFEELVQLNRNAVCSSFLEKSEKSNLNKLLDDFLQ